MAVNFGITSSGLVQDEFLTSIMDQGNLTDEWFLTRTCFPMLTVLTSYFTFLKLGPRYMASKPPYHLKQVMRVYNLTQMLLNASFVYKFVLTPNLVSVVVNTICSKGEHERLGNLKHVYMTYSWFYVVLKMIDLLDTAFMVLRKKNSHITFLHVYHHTCMVFFSWITLVYIKSHHAVIPGMINVVVHMIMYAYYFLATFPRLKRYLWWKQHLTKLQLGQFAVILLYMTLLYYKGCEISRVFIVIWIFNVSVIFVFFINFYVQAYIFGSNERSTSDRNHSKNT